MICSGGGESVIPGEVEAATQRTESREARLSIPLRYLTMAPRDPSTPLRFAQDDHFRFNFFQPVNEASLIPERIKVEPVVRRQTRIVLQPRDVALHPRLNLLRALLPIQRDLVGE